MTVPKGQAEVPCRVNAIPVQIKIPVLFTDELENWPSGLKVPETLLSLKKGNNMTVHV